MCTSRIVFVCRVGERPRQDIETPSRFGRSVADTVVEELAASGIWKKKKNERFGKRRTQPVITNCASDLAWLLQRFVFKVRIVWQSYQQGIVLFSLSLSFSLSLLLSLSWLSYLLACMQWLRFYGPSVQPPANLSFAPPSLSLLLTFFQRMNNLEKTNPHKSKKDDETWRWLGQPMPKRRSDTNLLVPWEVVVMMKIIITETKDRTHKQSMRFFCLLFYRKPTLSKVCWASRAPVTSLVTHTRFAVGFTRWHLADRKLQVANRRSISNLYQTQVWYLKISDLGEAEVWYLVVNEWLKVHYQMRACVWRVQKALDVFTRSHHKNVSKPIVCCIHLCMAFHSSVTWKVVDNLVCTFGSRKASGDLTCLMFIIDVIDLMLIPWRRKRLLTIKRRTPTAFLTVLVHHRENLTWIILVHFMRNDFVYLFGV